MVGVANTLLYAALLFFFLKKLVWGNIASVSSAYVLALIFQYTANRYFTFQSKDKVPRQFGKYLVSMFISYMLSLAIVEVCLNYLKISVGITVVICMFATTILVYLIGHFWVYK